MATSNVLKTMVSKNKKRFEEDGFNLDLSYITPRIIAMGYPAQDIEKLYRNDARTVLEFLNQRHPGHYKLFNLCRERQYDSAMFEGRVEWVPFEDHNPPRIEQIEPFCRQVHQWLTADRDNVVAIHCKAGKGRTGVMICCYLLYAGQFATPAEVLAFYGDRRTKDGKGVTIPSQRRYVEYFHRLMRQQRAIYSPPDLFLQSVTLEPERALESIAASVYCSVKTRAPNSTSGNGRVPLLDPDRRQKERKLVTSRGVEPARRAGDTCLRVPLDGNLALRGDFKLEVLCKPKNKLKPKEKLFWLWVNTYFVSGLCSQLQLQVPTPTGSVSEAVSGTLSKALDKSMSTPERMERASSCPEEENVPKNNYPIVSSCSDARLMPETGNRITLTLCKQQLDKACKDTRLPEGFKVHLSLVRRPGHVTSRTRHATGGSDSDTEEDEYDDYPDSGRESTHL